jgi:hypothetical protein
MDEPASNDTFLFFCNPVILTNAPKEVKKLKSGRQTSTAFEVT